MTGDDGPVSRTVLFALALVVVAAIAPTFGTARPANEIPVEDDPPDAASLSAPTANAWEEVPEVDVAMASAPSSVPNANDTSVDEVSVRAARTDGSLIVRLSWDDATADAVTPQAENRTPGVNTFWDAAALQLPADTSTHPGIAMGSERSQVNVWYWSAPNTTQELQAAGPGTTTTIPDTALDTNASYENGTWHVVFDRDLRVDDAGANRTTIEGERDVDVAIAVWNGSNAERSGQKAVSEWQYFPFGPGAQGPPYETILWVIAGLAIATVIVATTLGVRRT
ncbi:complex iron-sulfur molybdoenzyme family reductase subunit gamma [Halomicrobium zhouii]|uniref:Complex iron-sulfur molybdoenzyme family reductase subunit gamma n=1 Tax=Halomicrobium zhouii TaxID=767519 RepID=A0A1I6K7S7_9EURY|nr:ethylbenzene dehydrogenase-related protein [Halomicrobium zhouii]SFR87272.1 complex iron-sulfur molybdoenzyme family reductase subunit gamma [Halomicrobium zhouii]